jgi:hypothetical protein
MLFNGRLVRQAAALNQKNRFSQIVLGPKALPAKLDELYLTALSRKPSSREKRIALQWVTRYSAEAWAQSSAAESARDQVPPSASALQDIWWALLNSNEFVLNH